jgi:hypothetical protein
MASLSVHSVTSQDPVPGSAAELTTMGALVTVVAPPAGARSAIDAVATMRTVTASAT